MESGPILVAGVGNPWAGDLDFGPQFVRRFSALEWPPEVLLEDAAVAAQLFVHRLQELAPARVVVVACFPRGDPPGTIRCYAPHGPAPADEVQARLGESVSGVIDLDHVLVVARHYGALPERTTVIEVEPAEQDFGTAFSPAVEAQFGPVLELVRSVLADELAHTVGEP